MITVRPRFPRKWLARISGSLQVLGLTLWFPREPCGGALAIALPLRHRDTEARRGFDSVSLVIGLAAPGAGRCWRIGRRERRGRSVGVGNVRRACFGGNRLEPRPDGIICAANESVHRRSRTCSGTVVRSVPRVAPRPFSAGR